MRIRSDDLWSNSQCGWMENGRRTASWSIISDFWKHLGITAVPNVENIHLRYNRDRCLFWSEIWHIPHHHFYQLVYSAGKLKQFYIIKTKRNNFFPGVLTMDFCHSTLERNTCQDPVFKCQIQFDLSLFSEWWNKDTLNNTFCVFRCFNVLPTESLLSFFYFLY